MSETPETNGTKTEVAKEEASKSEDAKPEVSKTEDTKDRNVEEHAGQHNGEKRNIKKLLEDCLKNQALATKHKDEEEKCCSWHKYVFYALPLAFYLPWMVKVVKCPPKCCPPKYCCPPCEPESPPPKLKSSPTVTGCPPDPNL